MLERRNTKPAEENRGPDPNQKMMKQPLWETFGPATWGLTQYFTAKVRVHFDTGDIEIRKLVHPSSSICQGTHKVGELSQGDPTLSYSWKAKTSTGHILQLCNMESHKLLQMKRMCTNNWLPWCVTYTLEKKLLLGQNMENRMDFYKQRCWQLYCTSMSVQPIHGTCHMESWTVFNWRRRGSWCRQHQILS